MRLVTGLCVAFLLGVSAVCQGQTAPDNLPEGVVVLVEAANPNGAWQDLEKTATAITPAGKLPPLDELVARLTRTQDSSTLDLGKPMQLAMPASTLTEASAVALVFHVTDVQAYLGSLDADLQREPADGDLKLYSGPDGPIAIGSAGKQIVMGLGEAGDKAAADVLALLKAGKWPETAIGGEDDVAAAVRPAALLKALAAEGKDPFVAMKDAVQRSAQMTDGQPSAAMEAMFGAEVDILQGLLQQLDTVVFTADFSADDVVLRNRTRVVPGGSVSAYLAGLPAGKLTLQRYLPADSMGVVVGKVGDVKALLKGYDEFLRKLLGDMGAGQDEVDAVLKLADSVLDNTGGQIAEAAVLRPEGTVCVVYAAETTDPEAMKKQIDSMPALLDKLTGGIPGMPKFGVKTGAEPIVYKDRKITEWDYSFDASAQPGIPDAGLMADMQQKMMEAMYGGEAKAFGTFLGNTWVMAYGAGALDAVKAIIDGTATLEGSKRLEAAGAPGDQDVVGYVSLTDMAKWYLRLMNAMMSQMPLPIDLTAIQFPEAPDVVFSARMAQKDLAEGQMRVPTATIKALVQGAMTAYMQVVAGASGGGMGAGTGNQSDQSKSLSNLHEIGLAVYMWQADHDQAWPSDLAVAATRYLPHPEEVLVDPQDEHPEPIGSSGLKTSYVFVGSMPATASPDAIIAYTRKGVWPDGRNVLYLDGSVEFVTEAKLHGETPGARTTLQQSYDAVVAAYGSKLTPQDKARLQKFYEVTAPAAE